jgi:CheY-like chemotaxis protein
MASETKQKVLIIDDDKFLLNMYTAKFKKEGFGVDSASSGSEGLDKLRGDFKPDIIILDLIMPVMNGFEFLENMRSEKLGTSAIVIVLTNQNQDADIDHAKKLGAEGYIVKASSIPSEVVSRVSEIFAGKSK